MPLPAIAAGIARGVKIAKRAQKLRRARKATRARREALGRTRIREDRPELLSPEGIAMLTAAMVLDFIPPIFVLALNLFFGAGELVSWPIDIFGTIVLGGWMWISGGKMSFGKKFMQFIKKRGPFIVGEYIPIAGALPFWTINVFLFLKK